MIAAKWILILVLSNPCFSSGCPDTVAVTPVGPFESQQLCLAAGNFAVKALTKRGNDVDAVCVQQTLEKKDAAK